MQKHEETSEKLFRDTRSNTKKVILSRLSMGARLETRAESKRYRHDVRFALFFLNDRPRQF